MPTNVEDALDILASNASGPAPITWSSITSKPTTFPPTLPISSGSVTGIGSLITGKSDVGHTHVASDVVSGVFDYARMP
ncbi:hypothetical protein M3M44_09160, partial [Lactobacillus johnsonii]|nr:hypothetical protein [Lactobacillus johnsonii]